MNNDNITFRYPKVVYNMRANSSGDIIEVLNPVFKSKYGDIFDNPPNDYLGDNTDVASKLKSVGVYADIIENDELYVTKDGVNLQIKFVDEEVGVINMFNQILFLLKEFRIEQEQILEKTVEYTIERMGNY